MILAIVIYAMAKQKRNETANHVIGSKGAFLRFALIKVSGLPNNRCHDRSTRPVHFECLLPCFLNTSGGDPTQSGACEPTRLEKGRCENKTVIFP